ncbi:MAG: heme ABC exporter ATP-binding protein CcmA [Pseudomonadota bacterium]
MNDTPATTAHDPASAALLGGVIHLENLVVGRAGLPLTRPIEARFQAGSIWQISGVNGSGKTSLLRVLAGLLPAYAGRVTQSWLTGQPRAVYGFDGDWQRQVAWVPVTPAFKPGPTVNQVLALSHPGAASHGANQRRLAEACDHWGLAAIADQPVQYLSAGQRKRLDLARLMLDPRPVWLLDEPTVTLDAQARKTLALSLDHHRQQGGVTIMASHDDGPVTRDVNTLVLDRLYPGDIALDPAPGPAVGPLSAPIAEGDETPAAGVAS